LPLLGDGGRAEPADTFVASLPSSRALSPLPSQASLGWQVWQASLVLLGWQAWQASLVSPGWQVSQALRAWQAPQVWRVRQV
jgi:hypothetical protein